MKRKSEVTKPGKPIQQQDNGSDTLLSISGLSDKEQQNQGCAGLKSFRKH